MGARTTRRRPLPVARRHRQGLLCRSVTDRRASPRLPVSLRLLPSGVVPSVVCSSSGSVFCAHVHSAPFVPYQYRIPTAPSCVSLARVCASAFSSFSAAGRSYSSFHPCSRCCCRCRCGFCACFVDCLFPCRPSVVQLYHRSFHTLTPAHAPHSPPTRA